MESNRDETDIRDPRDVSDVAELLREDERAAAAPWVDYPAVPAWYPVAGGAWFAAWAWIVTADDWWATLLLVPLLAALGAYVGWYRRRRGTTPRWSGAPREINRALWLFIAIAAVLVVGGLVIDSVAGRWPMIAFVGVGVGVGLAVYEWSYARAARRTKERLG